MKSNSQHDDAFPSLNAAITTLDKARSDATGPKPAIDAFDAASALLTAIRVRFLRSPSDMRLSFADCRIQDSTINQADYIELGLACADDCQVISLRIKSRGDDRLSPSILRAIEQLTT